MRTVARRDDRPTSPEGGAETSRAVTRRDYRPASPGRGSRRGFAFVALLGLILTLFAAPLAAQDEVTADSNADFEVLRVDLTGNTGLVTVRPAVGTPPGEMTVTVEGEAVTATIAPIHRSPVDAYTVIVIDDSETADQVAGFSRIQSSALTFLDGLGSDTRVMLVRAGGGNPNTRPVVNFTSDHRAVRQAIQELSPGGGAVTWNAISNSVAAFTSQSDGVRTVAAFVGSPGLASTVTSDVAKGNLLSQDASLTIVAPQAANLDLSAFTDVSNSVRGGAIYRGNAEADMVAAGRLAAQVHESYIVGSFDTSGVVLPVDSGDNPTSDIVISYGGSTERVRIVPDGLAAGDSLLAPPLIETSRFEILRGNNGALIAIGLAVAAALLFSFSILSIFAGNDNTLNSTLSVYGSQDSSEEQRAADDAFASVRSRIVEQVVEKAEEAAASRGNLSSTTSMLEKAEIPLRAGEAFAIQVGIVVIALLLGFVLSGSPFVALGLAVPAGLLPSMYVKFKVKRRSKKLEAQLPDTLNLLSSTLKAGYSFVQGIDAVGNEAEEPLAGEFRRTVNEARLGKDLDEALDDLAERVDSVDLLWAVVAIKIQREVGGNLAELLSTVADTMTARTRLRGEVAALTAEGRVSALVLLVLPFGVGVAMYFMNREYISALWSSNIGYGAMGLAMVSMVIGSFWMKKIIDIKI
jgi:tight adherence protein B